MPNQLTKSERTTYFNRPERPIRIPTKLEDFTWAPEQLPDDPRIREEVVRPAMEEAFLHLLEIRADERLAERTEVRRPRALVLERNRENRRRCREWATAVPSVRPGIAV